ncbi:hypothetical protein B0J11DRAFT_521620 [Dendryphion nanum]|uniref:3-beta hydroxysteroid dehydrogenase/isomerase domain-containing protein n=1 Tax=Dendryphion nanum TaxID=256645 RepID=A0A9P9E6P2_9PLEO|nr:hypothetical protein B0J11DRAFT_521620 [Dendryphion nanum]
MDHGKFDTVLVAGGSGYLGSHIVERLLSGDHASKIIIASRKQPSTIPEGTEWHPLDVTSKDSVTKLFDVTQPQIVIHTVTAPHLARKLQEATTINGTSLLLEAAKNCKKTNAFIYTSSDSACHYSPFRQITEDQAQLYTSTTYNNPYGRAKAIADAAVLSANSPELRTASIRVPVIYGERDHNIIPGFVRLIRKGEHKMQIGPNEKMCEFVSVESAAEAHILAAKALNTSAPGTDGQAYFITDNQPQPFFTFGRKCCAAAGHPVPDSEIKVMPFWLIRSLASAGEWFLWVVTFGFKTPDLRRQDIDHLDGGCWWSTEKAERLLGYKPVIDQDEAIKRAMKWGMENC